MSIFGDIVSTIFKHAPAPGTAAGAPAAEPKPGSAPTASTPQGTPIDVTGILDKLAGQSREKLDWRKSIVDLMKLLNLDSSLGARQRLAKELNYTGNTNDSAAMNIWLHKEVMTKLAANGGKVPSELMH